MNILTIMFSLITGLNIDFGTEIFNLIKRSILTKTGKIDSHLPFPRFLSIIISDAFSERNLQTPKSKYMWRSEIMRPWSAAGSWKSDFDVPVLPENMMDLVPENSSYRAEYMRMLSRQAETKEGFEKVSPMEHDAEESSTPRIEHQDESDPHPAEEDVHMTPVAEEHHAEGSHMGETGATKSKLNIFYNSESDSDESIQGKYEILQRSTVFTKQNVSETKDPFSESDSEEENMVTTGGRSVY